MTITRSDGPWYSGKARKALALELDWRRWEVEAWLEREGLTDDVAMALLELHYTGFSTLRSAAPLLRATRRLVEPGILGGGARIGRPGRGGV